MRTTLLAIGLHSAGATSTKAADLADRAREAIQVGLPGIEHMAGIALKFRANLELARRYKALVSLSFDSDTKAQLHTSPLGHAEFFEGKLDEAPKQAKERGWRQRELKVSFKVPQAQSQASSASAPTYTFQASSQCSSQSGHRRGKCRSKKGKGCGHGKA